MTYTSQYSGSDLANMGIDVAGGFLNGLINQVGTLAILVVTIIVIAVVLDLLTGVFGIVKFIKTIGTRK